MDNNRITALEWTAAYATGALDCVAVKTQKNVLLAWTLPNLCKASPQRNDLIKLTLLEIVFILTNSGDTDEIQHFVVFNISSEHVDISFF